MTIGQKLLRIRINLIQKNLIFLLAHANDAAREGERGGGGGLKTRFHPVQKLLFFVFFWGVVCGALHFAPSRPLQLPAPVERALPMAVGFERA